MAAVMAVSFERYGRLYYCDPGDHDIAVGDWVLIPTQNGPEVAQCVWLDRDADFEGALPLSPGRAGPDDLRRDAANRARRAEIAAVARELIRQHELPMRVVAVDFVDRSSDFDQLSVVYFTAPRRVDFRALLGDLARALRSRIDLRQVGARDAAALLDGHSTCGRQLCCAVMGPMTRSVTTRMARDQDLTTNPQQIAGACGRMMCCLAYEHPLYVEFRHRAPALGCQVVTPDGAGVVVGFAVPADSIWVRGTAGVARCPVRDARVRVGSCPPTAGAASVPDALGGAG